MSPLPKNFRPHADPLKHLQYARQALIDELPPEHDLRQRVQAGSHGELLPEQPAGRPWTPSKSLPPRKRGRESCNPAEKLERRHLKKMWKRIWDDKYHLPGDRDKMIDKMRENRKKLGMRDRPHNEASSHKRGRANSPDNQGDTRRQSAAKQPSKKRLEKDDDTLAARYTSSNKEPANKKRGLSHTARRDAKESGQQRETARTAVLPLISSHSSEERSSDLSESQVRTLDGILNAPNSSLAATPTAPSPTITEVIHSSAILIRKLTELVLEHIDGDMSEFHVLLQDNANTKAGLGKGSSMRRTAVGSPCDK